MISIKYMGVCGDPSGYGASNRADVMALYVAGANITTETIQQTQFRTTYDIQEKVVKYLENRDIPYKIKILHITPDLYPKYMEEGKYHIGRLVWETDKLPKEWIGPCNKMDEIWTTTPRWAEVIKNSGVTVPIYSFPEPIEVREANEKITPFETKEKRGFTFYSIFQWIDRKNPRGLLRAYWKAFENRDDVTLLIKTYRVTYDKSEFEKIEQDIANWKKELNLKGKYPRVMLVEKLLKNSDIKKLHLMGDCFVNPSRGEGWCRPMVEAALYGKTIISSKCGGAIDLLPFKYDIPVKEETVVSQSWIPWYSGGQKWNVVNEDNLGEMMAAVYKNGPSAGVKDNQKFVIDNLSLKAIGDIMITRLSEIYEKISNS